MKLKSFRDLDVRGKIVLLRSDLNSDVVDGKVLKGERIRESLKTIKALRKMGARVVVLAHQGNPGKKSFLSLEQHAKLLGRGIKFVDGVVNARAVSAIKGMKDKDVLLLDNVRSVKDEFSPGRRGNVLVKKLAPLIDVYVNDAFSVCHRDHASIVGFAKVKEKGIGLLFERELRALEKVDMARNSVPSKKGTDVPSSSGKGCLYVLGGAKPESNIKLLGRGHAVIACGLFGQVCLASKGFDFGYQNKFLAKNVLSKGSYRKSLAGIRKKIKGVEMPVDFAVNSGGKRKEFGLDDFPMDLQIDDIGAESIDRFVRMIGEADSVYMKGPAGAIGDKKFLKGTFAILKAVSKVRFSLIGGGHLVEAIKKSGIRRGKFGHVSLSGGATLAYVAGERLVGLKALGYYR